MTVATALPRQVRNALCVLDSGYGGKQGQSDSGSDSESSVDPMIMSDVEVEEKEPAPLQVQLGPDDLELESDTDSAALNSAEELELELSVLELHERESESKLPVSPIAYPVLMESPVPFSFDTIIQGPGARRKKEAAHPRGLLDGPGEGCYPAKNPTEVLVEFYRTAHSQSRFEYEDQKAMCNDPDFKAHEMPTWDRMKQLQRRFPLMTLYSKTVGLSAKAVERLNAERKAKQKLLDRQRIKRRQQGLDSSSDDDAEPDGHLYTAPKTKTIFFDPVDILRRNIQWPGHLEKTVFLATMPPGGIVSQLSESQVYGGFPQYTAESVHVPALGAGARVGHGQDIVYIHDGVRQMGEVMGIFHETDARPYDNVTGTPTPPGGTEAALDRMRAAGGGPGGNPMDDVKMVFRVRPFSTAAALRSVGKLHDPPQAAAAAEVAESEGDPIELFALFDVEHTVRPLAVTGVAEILRSPPPPPPVAGP